MCHAKKKQEKNVFQAALDYMSVQINVKIAQQLSNFMKKIRAVGGQRERDSGAGCLLNIVI